MSDVETFYCLIVGSRSFSDYELFVAKCDLLLRNWGSVVIVSGGARGADALAKRYAVDRRSPALPPFMTSLWVFSSREADHGSRCTH